jgi:hypothetical protein
MSVWPDILPRRNRPVERDDFITAYQAGMLVDNAWPVEKIQNSTINTWNRFIPVLPIDIYMAFAKEMKELLKIELGLFPDGLEVSVYDQDAKKFEGNFFLTWNPSKASQLIRSGVKIDPMLQGMGIGVAFQKARMAVASALGHKGLYFGAADLNGAYSWSRMGAYLDMRPEFTLKRQRTSQLLIARLDALKPYIDLDVYELYRSLSGLLAKDDLVRLVNHTHILPSGLAVKMQEGKQDFELVKSFSDFFEIYPAGNERPQTSAFSEVKSMSLAFSAATFQNKPMTLARCLLSRMSFCAQIDFSDKMQMRHIQEYGVQKTLSFTLSLERA